MHIYIYKNIYENICLNVRHGSNHLKKEEKFSVVYCRRSVGGIGPGNVLDFGPAGWSKMAFMATHLSLSGKDKYFTKV